jgi:hypothetical protein
MSTTESSSVIRKRRRAMSVNRSYQHGYEDGFELGTRSGANADRVTWFAWGALAGAAIALLARALT